MVYIPVSFADFESLDDAPYFFPARHHTLYLKGWSVTRFTYRVENSCKVMLIAERIEVNLPVSLKSSRLLEDMATRGIKYVDCYGVDNALVSLSLFCDKGSRVQVRVADPTFLGYFIDKGVAAAKYKFHCICMANWQWHG
ncbi:hypothetical protein V6N13_090831 [Hibiscus sabdariffa]|uniref:Uncharacterized protein n=1 Tax=Hibiscus sabdariffa TaxID=183260 RepID=A0ABR1Z931_9ROSI